MRTHEGSGSLDLVFPPGGAHWLLKEFFYAICVGRALASGDACRLDGSQQGHKPPRVPAACG